VDWMSKKDKISAICKKVADFEVKQTAVGRRSSVTIAVISLVMYVLPSYAPRYHTLSSFPERMELVLPCTLLPVATLFLAIINMALFRVHSPADIDAALAEPSKLARVYQSMIQNTLEQTALAIPIYTVAGTILPSSRLVVVPYVAILFFIGRIAFFLGYSRSAPGRSIGFTLTVIPTLLLFLEVLVHQFLF
jgi:uncharacterized MAPEG superfamily protein